MIRAFPVAFLPRATVAKRLHDRNDSRTRHEFPEDLRLVVRKNALQSEGFYEIGRVCRAGGRSRGLR